MLAASLSTGFIKKWYIAEETLSPPIFTPELQMQVYSMYPNLTVNTGKRDKDNSKALAESGKPSMSAGPPKARRTTANAAKFSQEQVKVLEEAFEQDPKPDTPKVRMLAMRSGMTYMQCRAWFQYKRKKCKTNEMEWQSQMIYSQIQCLNSEIRQFKEKNVSLLVENALLRKEVLSLESMESEVLQGIHLLSNQRADIADDLMRTFRLVFNVDRRLTFEQSEEVPQKDQEGKGKGPLLNA